MQRRQNRRTPLKLNVYTLPFADHVHKLQILLLVEDYICCSCWSGRDLTVLALMLCSKPLYCPLCCMQCQPFQATSLNQTLIRCKPSLTKHFKLEYLSSVPDLRSLISRADRQLFNKLNTNPQHCLVPHFAPCAQPGNSFNTSCPGSSIQFATVQK